MSGGYRFIGGVLCDEDGTPYEHPKPKQAQHDSDRLEIKAPWYVDRIMKLEAALQMGLDFYHLDTWQWTQKYGHGMTTKQLGDVFREALGPRSEGPCRSGESK